MSINMSTEVLEEVEVSTGTGESNKIVVYNDDVNSFDHVINCFMKYCKHTPEQAEQCTTIIHFNGKCDVKNGDIDELVPICNALTENKISAKIE